MSTYRMIPSIEQLRQRKTVRSLETEYGNKAIIEALREETASVREELSSGSIEFDNTDSCARLIENRLEANLQSSLSPSLRPVINGAGVIIHTNLGRAPLSLAAIERIGAIAAYSNLEYDLSKGTRGTRAVHASGLLRRLTGAEDAVIVNNNAAALLITLTALASGREAIISRGELVEIGGGFRIPDVMRQSGAQLREVGTTNRTRAADYAAAINDRTALLLRVHPSNFSIEGFGERPSLEEITEIGRRFNLPVVEDLGSGNLLDRLGGTNLVNCLDGEPTISSSMAAGVTVCCFSGDKLLGGPQSGIIIGRCAELETIRSHALMRALRADKLVYAALEATLLEHATGRAAETVPLIRMINTSLDSLKKRARRIIKQITNTTTLRMEIMECKTAIGGGTTPGVTVPSLALAVTFDGSTPENVEARLRQSSPPVIARIERGHVLIDLRTVQPNQDDLLTMKLADLPKSLQDS